MYLSNQILLLVYTHSSVPEHTHIKKQYPAIYVINLLLHQFPFVAFDRQVQGSQKQWGFFPITLHREGRLHVIYVALIRAYGGHLLVGMGKTNEQPK